MDTTHEFQIDLTIWTDWQPKQKATDQQLSELLYNAENARTTSGWEWGALFKILTDRADLTKEDATAEVKRCRIKADLGTYPLNVHDFITAWLKARGYVMGYSTEFEDASGVVVGVDTILDKLNIWCDVHKEFKGTYESALRLHMEEQRRVILTRKFAELRFDPNIDPDQSELKKWVRLVVREEADEEITARNYRAAEVALMNFIYRVKNHIGAAVGQKHKNDHKRWTHWTHVMPVLYGTQEDGKTLAMKTFVKPLGELSTGMGFEILDDNSKQYQLSYMPVMTFDELAGLAKADAEKLKGIMHEERKSLREIYRAASTKTLITTFFGCTNKDINDLIKDETGNRRFYQMFTRKVDSAAMLNIDVLKIWKSVDEDALVSPWYANPDDLAAVKAVQAEQRHKSSVEIWLESCTNIPQPTSGNDWLSTNRLFTDSYFPWLEEHFPSEVKLANLIKFGRELQRLDGARHPQVKATYRQKAWRYQIQPNNVVEITDRRVGDLMSRLQAEQRAG